jgi:hypothetical protein
VTRELRVRLKRFAGDPDSEHMEHQGLT